MKLSCVNVNNFINFKASISDNDIDGFKDAKQYYSDCYLMTTLEALSHTKNGRKLLKNQIEYDDANSNIINCYLYNPKGVREKYSVPTDEAVKGYKKLYTKQPNEIIRSMDISVGEYEKKYKAKPWVCRVTDNFKTYQFENNLPSHFMEIFTGKKPNVVGEMDFNLDLSNYKDKVMPLLERMDKEKNYSFVISTGAKMLNGHSWHVYMIENVDIENGTITVKEKRGNKPQTMSIDTALRTFKFMVGYFDSDLD